MTWVRKALKIFDVSLSNMEAEQRKTIERPCWKMTLGQKLKPISKIFNTFSIHFRPKRPRFTIILMP